MAGGAPEAAAASYFQLECQARQAENSPVSSRAGGVPSPQFWRQAGAASWTGV